MKTKTTIIPLFFILILSGNFSIAEDVSSMLSSPSVARNPFTPQFPIKKEEPLLSDPAKKIIGSQNARKNQKAPEEPPVENIVPPPLVVTGLIWDSDRPQAIINGQVVSNGDTVSEAKIVSIKKAAIEIAYKGKTFSITP